MCRARQSPGSCHTVCSCVIILSVSLITICLFPLHCDDTAETFIAHNLYCNYINIKRPAETAVTLATASLLYYSIFLRKQLKLMNVLKTLSNLFHNNNLKIRVHYILNIVHIGDCISNVNAISSNVIKYQM